MWGWSWIERLGQELRVALRALRRNSGFTVIAVIVLALGTGANTAIFSVVNAVLLRPLPFHDPDRVMLVWEKIPKFDDINGPPKTPRSSYERARQA
jgi:hypothetical protein